MQPSDLTFDRFVAQTAARVTTPQRLLVLALTTILLAAIGGVGIGTASQGNPPAVECDGIENYLNKFDDMHEGEGGTSGAWDREAPYPGFDPTHTGEDPAGTFFTAETPDAAFVSGFTLTWTGGTTFSWTSTTEVGYVVTKGGSDNGKGNGNVGYSLVTAGGTSGTVDVASDLPSDGKLAGLSHVTFCGPDADPPDPDVFAYTITLTCLTETSADLALTNEPESTADITFGWSVETGDAASGSQVVSPDATHNETLTFGDDGLSVNVTIDGQAYIGNPLSVQPCGGGGDTFSATVTGSYTCGSTGSFSISNTGTGSITFTYGGGEGDQVTLPGGGGPSNHTFGVNSDTGGAWVVTTDAEGVGPFGDEVSFTACPSNPDPDPDPEPEPQVLDVVLVNDPAASASFSCGDGGFVFLDNSASDGAVTFVVTIDGTSTEFDVGAGSVRNLPFDIEEDATAAVTVTAGGETLVDESFTADCAEVLGIIIENPPAPAPAPEPDPEPAPEPPVEVAPIVQEAPELPATGASTSTLALLGGMTAVAGAMLLLRDRRRRAPA